VLKRNTPPAIRRVHPQRAATSVTADDEHATMLNLPRPAPSSPAITSHDEQEEREEREERTMIAAPRRAPAEEKNTEKNGFATMFSVPRASKPLIDQTLASAKDSDGKMTLMWSRPDEDDVKEPSSADLVTSAQKLSGGPRVPPPFPMPAKEAPPPPSSQRISRAENPDRVVIVPAPLSRPALPPPPPSSHPMAPAQPMLQATMMRAPVAPRSQPVMMPPPPPAVMMPPPPAPVMMPPSQPAMMTPMMAPRMTPPSMPYVASSLAPVSMRAMQAPPPFMPPMGGSPFASAPPPPTMMIATRNDNGNDTFASLGKLGAVLAFAALVCFLARPYMFPDMTGAAADVESAPVAATPVVIAPSAMPPSVTPYPAAVAASTAPAPSGVPMVYDMRNVPVTQVAPPAIVPPGAVKTAPKAAPPQAQPQAQPQPRASAQPAQPKPQIPVKTAPGSDDTAEDDLQRAQQETSGSLN
jgi:hypothetical protein